MPSVDSLYGFLESDHDRDFHDYPLCARECLLDRSNGYWYRSCTRGDGGCCPGAKPQGIQHYAVWDCVQQRCGVNTTIPGGAQTAADIFMRECANHGYAFSSNFTSRVPSAYEIDRFPGEYQFKDFVTPAAVAPVPGFYAWGSMLAWTFALIAAALSGIRPCLRSKFGNQSGILQKGRRWFWYVRRDAELLGALAIPCLAAADVYHRTRRYSFHQMFSYSYPSFVPSIDGNDKATDIITIRAALVVLNHFVISSIPVAALPWIILGLAGRLGENSVRQTIRTLAILGALVWCNVATKDLFCGDVPLMLNDMPGSCSLTYTTLMKMANVVGTLPGVSCGPDQPYTDLITIFVTLSFSIACARWCQASEIRVATVKGGLSFLLSWFAIFIVAVSTLFVLGYLVVPYVGTAITFANFWYFTSEGRQCTFGPSSMIPFSDWFQIFVVTMGAFMSLVSAWDSLSSFRDSG